MKTKAWWKSKTLWVNALSIVALVFGSTYIEALVDPRTVAIVLGAVNMFLRAHKVLQREGRV